jgi:pyrimidine-nucleoside phosphorylase
MRAVDVIRAKRDRQALSDLQIELFVHAAATGAWPDYQLSALLMAIVLNGMTPREAALLTYAMTHSGKVYHLDDIPGIKVDKHSTGGVGDKTSLILAPLVAACGVVVPMMSGRGLGHTGGTLDKLEAIPGFRVQLSEAEFRDCLRSVGIAMIGQSDHVAPADKKLYALRDVTGTVESIPLITASILSKKIAEGISGLVMDVKFGRGAFMKSLDDARALAESIVRVGTANGLTVEALLTDMNSPLGQNAGHTLEVKECIDTLKNQGPKDVTELSVTLAARMVRLGGAATTEAEAEARVRAVLASGKGLELFRKMIEAQGGDPRVVDNPERMPTVADRALVRAPRSGFLSVVDAENVGRAILALGGGRTRAEDRIDHAVGVRMLVKPGQTVQSDEPILEVHHRSESGLTEALNLLKSALVIQDEPADSLRLIAEVLS